jgi:hypothetical protein
MKCLNTKGCYGKDAKHLDFYWKARRIVTNKFCSKECYLIYIGEKPHPILGTEPKKRGVKKGAIRGPYTSRKTGAIEDKRFITTKCKQCGNNFRYLRKGKRLREYCSNKCKQKYYRENKKRKEIKRKEKLW